MVDTNSSWKKVVLVHTLINERIKCRKSKCHWIKCIHIDYGSMAMLMGSNPKGPYKHGTNGFITFSC